MGKAYRFFDTAKGMHVAALGVGASTLVEGQHQGGLVHVQQFGISADVATGKGVPG
ncbi:hypothetical protein D3C77_518770 [compost metagenome]